MDYEIFFCILEKKVFQKVDGTHFFVYICSMISLARHIEILLLEHDCVVIPGFGGFITKAEEAKFLEHEWQMMPPFRTVRFNQALQANDGLLVQSYMNIYDASFPAAQKQMQMEIKKEVEAKYNVNVVSVNTVRYNGKAKRRYTRAGVISGRTNAYKKAIVTLQAGETIDFYSNI